MPVGSLTPVLYRVRVGLRTRGLKGQQRCAAGVGGQQAGRQLALEATRVVRLRHRAEFLGSETEVNPAAAGVLLLRREVERLPQVFQHPQVVKWVAIRRDHLDQARARARPCGSDGSGVVVAAHCSSIQ